MLFVEGELAFNVLDFSLFLVEFLHEAMQLLQGDLDDSTAVGVCRLG